MIYREKDVVNFDDENRFKHDPETDELIDAENDNVEVGCEICYTHEMAKDVIPESTRTMSITVPLCPYCGQELDSDGLNYVVGEANFSQPEARIYKMPVFTCDNCDKTFGMFVENIEYNANHCIYYTGGTRYLPNKDDEALKNAISEAMKDSLKQYLDRKIREGDTSIHDWNVHLWCTRDAEHAIAKWLYDRGIKH